MLEDYQSMRSSHSSKGYSQKSDQLYNNLARCPGNIFHNICVICEIGAVSHKSKQKLRQAAL